MSDIRGFSVSDVRAIQGDIANVLSTLDDDCRGDILRRDFWTAERFQAFSQESKDIFKRRKSTLISRVTTIVTKLAYDLFSEQRLVPRGTHRRGTHRRERAEDDTESLVVGSSSSPLIMPAKKRVQCLVFHPLPISCPPVVHQPGMTRVIILPRLARQWVSREILWRRMDAIEFELCRSMRFNDVGTINDYETLDREHKSAEKTLAKFVAFYGDMPHVAKKRRELEERAKVLGDDLERLKPWFKRAVEVVGRMQQLIGEWQRLERRISTCSYPSGYEQV